MGGLPTRGVPWSDEDWEAFEEYLASKNQTVEHCAHCDRSNRHPTCYVRPMTEREIAERKRSVSGAKPAQHQT